MDASVYLVRAKTAISSKYNSKFGILVCVHVDGPIRIVCVDVDGVPVSARPPRGSGQIIQATCGTSEFEI